VLGLGKKRQALLGVEFSAASIKVLELGEARGGYRVDAFAVEALPDGAVVDKECRDVAAVATALTRALKRSGTKLTHCAMAVPSSTIITRTLQLSNKLSEAELEGQVIVEADQYIPYNIEDVSLDFQVLGNNVANPALLDVLVVASRRENVESRVAVAEAAKLTVEVMDVEAYAVEHASRLLLNQLPDREAKPVVAVIDVGSSVTKVYVMSESQGVIYTREQDFGGRILTEEIMRRYGLDMEQAGNGKINGDLPPDYAAAVLEPFKQNMMDQVQRLLQYFYVTRPHDSINQIFLGGGCAAIPGIDEMLEEATGTPVATANPFHGMPLGRRVNQVRFENDAPATLTACGLALRGFAT